MQVVRTALKTVLKSMSCLNVVSLLTVTGKWCSSLGNR